MGTLLFLGFRLGTVGVWGFFETGEQENWGNGGFLDRRTGGVRRENRRIGGLAMGAEVGY